MLIDVLIHIYMNDRDMFNFYLHRSDKNSLIETQNIIYQSLDKYPHISIEKSILKAIYHDIGECIYD